MAAICAYGFPAKATAGRVHGETAHPYRNPFQRDRDRIVHCAAFRRLSGKMQVFTAEFGNYHRTRLTHTLEVACIARTIGRALGLNEDLIEASAYLHDIGHPPFGHTGEDVLNRLLADSGGFEHNAQALRIVEKREQRYAGFPGLNLSREILDGQRYKMGTSKTPLLEIQTMDVADSIAYDTHDVDDAMELGLLTAGQVIHTALWKAAAYRVRQLWTNLDDAEFRRAVIHHLIERQVSNVIETAKHRLQKITSYETALKLPVLIAPSAELAEEKAEMEAFLLAEVYRHPQVTEHRRRVSLWLETLFRQYVKDGRKLPERYADVIREEGIERATADYLADQTDRSVKEQIGGS
ncbi:MAG: dNTP triphosphohydrolase [Planctomycetaceae bacterium]|jgi:dGTPase|nr:dNTP triphosphohydrolase [Planctomycetaceae bacterium]